MSVSLTRLGAANPRQARVVELRYFGGLSVDQIARILDLSPPSVKRQAQLVRSRTRNRFLHVGFRGRAARFRGAAYPQFG
jgi:DNA-directed RNA polymerase specialized sigma24 family protein